MSFDWFNRTHANLSTITRLPTILPSPFKSFHSVFSWATESIFLVLIGYWGFLGFKIFPIQSNAFLSKGKEASGNPDHDNYI